VPDESYDEKSEADKEFLDIVASVSTNGGLEYLSTLKVGQTPI
jgi:hypothetical protein